MNSLGRHGRFAAPHAPPRRSAAYAHEKQLLLRRRVHYALAGNYRVHYSPNVAKCMRRRRGRKQCHYLFHALVTAWTVRGRKRTGERISLGHSFRSIKLSLCASRMYFGKRAMLSLHLSSCLSFFYLSRLL